LSHGTSSSDADSGTSLARSHTPQRTGPMTFRAPGCRTGVGRPHAGGRGTGDDPDGERTLSFLTRGLPPQFDLRVVTLAPGGSQPYDDGEWDDALVAITAGAIELECQRGGTRRFVRGDILWFTGLQLRTIHNRGNVSAVLIAVSRRS
jgi:hypothetical protein